jgi:hypothetical protein
MKMKHLKTYKLFESIEDNNEDYLTLSHLLYDFFDKWGIIRDEDTTEFDDLGFSEDNSQMHKFWSFMKKNGDFIKDEYLNSSEVYSINIFNIKSEEKDILKNELDDVLKEASDTLSKYIKSSYQKGNSIIENKKIIDYFDFIIHI